MSVYMTVALSTFVALFLLVTAYQVGWLFGYKKAYDEAGKKLDSLSNEVFGKKSR